MKGIKNPEDWTALLNLAEAQDSVAQYEVAYYYDYGLKIEDTEIVSENKPKAFEWYYIAYKNGNRDAIIPTANFLSEGIYCDQNIGLAVDLYHKEIAIGSGLAANNLGLIFRDRQEYEIAFEWYKVAQGLDKSPSLRVALCHYLGIGTKKDVKEAFDILLQISKDAHVNSQYDVDEANYLLGKIYLNGDAVEKSIPRARHFLKLADADHDHRSAQELLIIIGRNDQTAQI